MQWSLATVALVPRGATRHANLEEQRRVLAWAKRSGFAGLEVSPQWLKMDDAPPGELAAFGQAVRDAGLTVSGINVNRCLFTRGPGARESLGRAKRAIDAAAFLGTRLVTVSLSLPLDGSSRAVLRGCDIPDDERERAADELSELSARAAQEHIELSLELHDDGMLDTGEYCLDMVQRVGATNVGVNPDLGNLTRSKPSANWRAVLKQLAPLANNWHVKNYRGEKPAPLWEGDIDYAEAMQIMLASGYQEWVSIESYFGDVLPLQERSLAYLKELAAAINHSRREKEPAA